LEPWLRGARPAAEVGILALGRPQATIDLSARSHSAEVEGAAQLFLEAGIQFDILDPAVASFSGYRALLLPDGAGVDDAVRAKIEAFMAGGGRLVLSGTAGLDPANGTFRLPGVPVSYVGPAPTMPSYLRLDATLVADSQLATDYDYVFYDQAHLVRPLDGARAHGDLSRALFNRTWEHFTSHAHAPVGERLGAPIAVSSDTILFFAAPLFGAYRTHDYWAYRQIALNALRRFLPPLLLPSAPGWAEFTRHDQPAGDGHAARTIVHVVTYHPRRTLQAIPHVDQAGQTFGLSVRVHIGDQTPQRVYLAPEEQPLAFEHVGAYVRIDLPPVGAHAVGGVE